MISFVRSFCRASWLERETCWCWIQSIGWWKPQSSYRHTHICWNWWRMIDWSSNGSAGLLIWSPFATSFATMRSSYNTWMRGAAADSTNISNLSLNRFMEQTLEQIFKWISDHYLGWATASKGLSRLNFVSPRTHLILAAAKAAWTIEVATQQLKHHASSVYYLKICRVPDPCYNRKGYHYWDEFEDRPLCQVAIDGSR